MQGNRFVQFHYIKQRSRFLSHSTEHKEQKLVSKLQKEEEEESWLELGLGLGYGKAYRKIEGNRSNPISDSPSSSSAFHVKTNSHQIGLGLEWSPAGDESLRQVVEGVVPASSGDHYNKNKRLLTGRSLADHCYSYDHHHNDNGIPLWPSWHMDPQDWHMPVPCDPHHYTTTSSSYQSGLWFALRASTKRKGEALPQVPKAYIRVKDENVTVFMVKKYLVRKLGLSNEAEIDVSCMGQSLSHMQTLKQVRDTVWLPRLIESPINSTTVSFEDTQLPHDVSTNHLMSLQYRRQRILN
ncbi:E3 ubiquitin protein ligase drip2 [Quillaja saponaria]|uniref:E3 ubiquitin protein ligase drip2 n=1 Tax=Quillaja saponaria TaxID=32244 RepID=A0AAD7LF90_QUISA|nr:E3 ubiquitin protein ligase drip2 [Quillaja saponaria]